MTKQTKIIIITTSLLAVAGVTYAATRKKKNPVKTAVRKIVKVIVPGYAKTDDQGSETLKTSSTGQYVEWLQETLNDLHAAAKYITKSCDTFWPVYSGNTLSVSGTFDTPTQNMMKFYLAKTEIDIDDMLDVRSQLASYTAGNDKCKYPLSY